MNNYGNRCKACLCVSAVIAASALANTNEATRCHLTETPERRAMIWQAQVSKMWPEDTFEAKNAATNVIAAIKAITDATERRRVVSEYARTILNLDVKNEYSTINPAYRRRFLFNDAIDLLDQSEEGVFCKWSLRLDYCRRIQEESEWLESVAANNIDNSFVMTGEVVIVSSPEFTKRFGPPCSISKSKGSRFKDLEYRRRSVARAQNAYAKFMREMLDEEEREYYGDVFKRDCARLSQEKQQALHRRKVQVFGKK